MVGSVWWIYLLILHFKFQFFKSMEFLTFHIPQFNLSFKKNYLYLKYPQIIQKLTRENRKTLVWHCLKLERGRGTKAMSSDVETSFRCTPALKSVSKKDHIMAEIKAFNIPLVTYILLALA